MNRNVEADEEISIGPFPGRVHPFLANRGLKPPSTVTDTRSMAFLVWLAIWSLVAFLAYRESENFKKKNGVTPWHWPSWVWALVGFFSFVLVAVLLWIARRNTKPAIATATPAMAGGNSVFQGPAPAHWAPPASPASWQRDPTGRYASRYWDGSRWTQYVSDGNSTTSDPVSV